MASWVRATWQYRNTRRARRQITPQQFADLNAQVGGLVTDPHAAADVPMPDLRGAEDVEIHTVARAWHRSPATPCHRAVSVATARVNCCCIWSTCPDTRYQMSAKEWITNALPAIRSGTACNGCTDPVRKPSPPEANASTV